MQQLENIHLVLIALAKSEAGNTFIPARCKQNLWPQRLLQVLEVVENSYIKKRKKI